MSVTLQLLRHLTNKVKIPTYRTFNRDVDSVISVWAVIGSSSLNQYERQHNHFLISRPSDAFVFTCILIRRSDRSHIILISIQTSFYLLSYRAILPREMPKEHRKYSQTREYLLFLTIIPNITVSRVITYFSFSRTKQMKLSTATSDIHIQKAIEESSIIITSYSLKLSTATLNRPNYHHYHA